MAYAIDDHWLFHGMAEREVYGIQGLVPQEWGRAMARPVNILKELKEKSAH